jgi:hypothetical protein
VEDHPVTQEVRALAGLNLEGLRAEWRRRYGDPPKLRSVDLLARILSWRMQAEVFGGIDPATKKLLLQKSMPKPGPRLDPGMRLEREWRGRKEIVDVVEDGFRWNGETYKSLSRIARAMPDSTTRSSVATCSTPFRKSLLAIRL